MVLRKIMGLFVCALVIGSAAFATAGIPDPDETIATMPSAGAADVVLFVLPNGLGSSFAEAQVKGAGTEVDATIEMIVKDANGVVVPNFPAEDMWLESADEGFVPCAGGADADQNSNDEGYTRWATALNGSGSSEALCQVYVNGLPLNGDPFPLSFNSADMNADGDVTLSDIGIFTSAFFGGYDFAADFFADGVLNLSDIGRLASGLGAACP